MKPMLIIPPAPIRWPALNDLLHHKGQPWLRDIELRLTRGVPGAQDAYAVMPSSAQFLAGACINRFRDTGILGHCYTRPEHRRRGYAHRLITTLLSWFEMTGGRRLYLSTTAELDLGLYGKFGFEPLRRAAWAPADRLTMVRVRGAAPDPFADLRGDLTLRDLTRAEWPAMVMLLQHRPGADPRVPLEESAVTAEAFTLDLIDHQERAAGILKGAFHGDRLVAIGMLAIDRAGDRTYGLLLPHTGAPPQLRAAILDLAHTRGYTQVDFPMEALVGVAATAEVVTTHAAPASPQEAPTLPPPVPEATAAQAPSLSGARAADGESPEPPPVA